jgi:ERCC4-type nuclease
VTNRELDKFQRDALRAHSDQSKRKPRAPKPAAGMTIICDTREQCPWTFSDSVTVISEKLNEGDYAPLGFKGSVAIERKSADDFAGSMTFGRERFEAEMLRLKPYKFKAIVVEATEQSIWAHHYQSLVKPSLLMLSTWAFFMDYGVATYFWGSPDRCARGVEWFFRRVAKCWQTSGD